MPIGSTELRQGQPDVQCGRWSQEKGEKRCSTRDVAPKAKTAYLKTSRPVLVLYFPTNGKASVVLERTATQPHGKRSAAYLQGCPFAWSFGVLNFF